MTESVSIIVPAFNEADSIGDVLDEIFQAMKDFSADWELIVVDDGSTDDTAKVTSEKVDQCKNLRLIRHEQNQGSGGAIRTGIDQAKMDLVIYLPADGQVNPSEIQAYVSAALGADIVLGVRTSRNDYSIRRKAQSFVYLKMVNLFFGQSFRDVNWVHLWRRDKINRIQLRSDGVFMLQEIVCIARKEGWRIVEVPSIYRTRIKGLAKGGSLKSILCTLHDFFTHLVHGPLPLKDRNP